MTETKNRPPAAGIGKKKGTQHKTTVMLKEAILLAAENAGGKEGMVGYLTAQAKKNPKTFLQLLGRVLPMQITGEGDGPLQVQIVRYGDNPPAE